MNKFDLDDRVFVVGKNVCGTIAYVGETHFLKGEWFGIILDQPKGRNNGCVDGERYFKCPRNYGIFVRACQLKECNPEDNTNKLKVVYPNYLGNASRSVAYQLKECKSEGSANKFAVVHPNYLGNSSKSVACQLGKEDNSGQDDNGLKLAYKNNLSNSAGDFQIEKTLRPEKNNESRPTYPNYLKSSSRLKDCCHHKKRISSKEKTNGLKMTHRNCLVKSSNTRKILNNVKANKEIKENVSNIIHPITDPTEELKQDLQRTSEELSAVERQKEETVNKLRSLEADYEKLSTDFNRKLEIENSLKKELLLAQKHISVIEKKQWRSAKNFNISEKKRRKLEITTESLREMTEHVIVEKEIAEEKSEYLELLLKDETENRKQLEIDSEIMKEEMQIQCVDGIPAVHNVKKLEIENTVLKNALHRLKDLYNTLQNQLSMFEQEIEKNVSVIRSLRETEVKLDKVISKYKEEVNDLYESIDVMLNADDIVFEVTERNFEYEDKIRRLNQELNESEELLEISEEVEETLEEIKSICKEEIECLEAKVKKTEIASEKKTVLLQNKQVVIYKYRELTTLLEDKNRNISEELKTASRERNNAVVMAENLKLKVHRVNKKTLNDLIHLEILKIDLDNAEEQIKCWSPFMPDTFFGPEGGNFVIQVKLLTSKMLKKINLLIGKLKPLLFDIFDISSPAELQLWLTETKLLIFAFKLQCLLLKYKNSLDRMDLQHFMTVGKNYEIMIQKKLEIDNFLKLFCRAEIDSKNCLDCISTTYYTLSEILDCKYGNKLHNAKANTESHLNIAHISCKCIISHCNAIDTFEIAENHKALTKHASNLTKALENNINSILNIIKNDDKNSYLLPNLANILNRNSEHIQEAMNYFTAACSNISDETINIYPGDEESHSLKKIINKIEKVGVDIVDLHASLKNGEFFIECTEDSKQLSPIEAWAQLQKQQVKENITYVRNQVVSCELEIIKLAEALRNQRKIKFIQNHSIKDVAPKDWGHQVSGTTQTKLLACAGDCSSTTKYLSLKLQDMECSMRYLNRKVFELKLTYIKDNQKLLGSLEVLPKFRYDPDVHRINTLQKKLNELAGKLRSILVPLVVDVSSSKGRNKGKLYRRYLVNRMLVRKEIEDEIWNIVCEIRRLRNQRCVWSIPSPLSLQNNQCVENQ